MSLISSLESDYITAMKAKDADKVSVLRMVKAACGHAAIEKKKNQLDDAETVDVIRKQVKQRRESQESFEKAGRKDLAEKEARELAILQAYLPKELSDEEIKAFIQQAKQKSGAATKADMGKLMKELMPLVKGKADGRRVNDLVNSMLS
jgi:hypothetical protein